MNYLSERRWMYNRKGESGWVKKSFLDGLDVFMNFATNNDTEEVIRCPCVKCDNRKLQKNDIVREHLLSKGFALNYHIWKYHGEVERTSERMNVDDNENETNNYFEAASAENRMVEMVYDAAGPILRDSHVEEHNMEEDPNPQAKKFYDLLQAANRPLWNGCETHTELSATARFIAIKAKYNTTENEFDAFLQVSKEMLPPDNVLAQKFYNMKKQISAFGLPYQKIDTCKSGCMIYWKDDINLTNCKFCNSSRYIPKKSKGKNVPYTRMHYLPITPRLQRLYTSPATACHMRWHKERTREEGVLCHPSDGEAWKHFDSTYPNFANESRNVRLGLCTDGFAPFSQFGSKYSSWPVILTPYNLPPWMCMKNPYMFLTLIVPGPQNPKNGIDVYLQPLIDELKKLWNEGIITYDISKKNNFRMYASLLWTISDFPAYGMLSGWSTSGRLACPYCMEHTQAFRLQNGGKQSWFDCHRCFLHINDRCRYNKKNFKANKIETRSSPPNLSSEEIYELVKDYPKVHEVGKEVKILGKGKTHNWCKQSIFWELPYWKHLLLRHNIDVMHNEKNMFENVFNTVLNVSGKTKDDLKSRRDIALYCKRPELELDPAHENIKPLACYELDHDRCKKLLEWICTLKFPDGIASNIRRCVDLKSMKMSGMKSHDCHVFIETLFPIAFKELLPIKVWKVITELSMFYKDLCSTSLKMEHLKKLEEDIPLLLCKMEQIFPPSVFNVMEHLPIHLPSEALLRGPVQYGWMYPFERYLGHLKKKIKQKARIEGSICRAYIVEEASTFFNHYFEEHVKPMLNSVPRNDEGAVDDSFENFISVFRKHGRSSGKCKEGWLNDKDLHTIRTYVLLNCAEVAPFIRIFEEEQPTLELSKNFLDWFLKYVRANNIVDIGLKYLAHGPQLKVRKFPTYFVNGFKFHTHEYGAHKSTFNSGVCVKGSDDPNAHIDDYYGVLNEIIELTYSLKPEQKVVLFKCDWFNNKPNVGIRVHKDYPLIEVNHTLRYSKYDPFVLARQAIQVYYTPYPSINTSKSEWWAVCKTKARYSFDTNILNDQAYQADFEPGVQLNIERDDDIGPLNDESNVVVELFENEDDDEEEDIEVENEFDTDTEAEDDSDEDW